MSQTQPPAQQNRSLTPSAIGGIVLIALGVLFLGAQFLAPDLFRDPIHIGTTIGATIFFGGAVAFAAVLVSNVQKHWWAVFPAFPLAALGVIVLQATNVDFALHWAGTTFLGGVGLAFFAALALRPGHYWPIISGGMLLSLAVQAHNPFDTGVSFLLGAALTFLATFAYGLLTPRKAYWALIPAAIFGVLGFGLQDFTTLNWFGPALLVLLGVVMLIRRAR